jgi:hypothetical protein
VSFQDGKSNPSTKQSESKLNDLTNINDRWTLMETLEAMVANPVIDDKQTIEKAINILCDGEFKPYSREIDPVDSHTACQGIIYYARTNVLQTSPYDVQAMIPYVGNQADFISRQLRSMEKGNLYFVIYKLLEAQLEIASIV